jgi:hypothetical protein
MAIGQDISLAEAACRRIGGERLTEYNGYTIEPLGRVYIDVQE